MLHQVVFRDISTRPPPSHQVTVEIVMILKQNPLKNIAIYIMPIKTYKTTLSLHMPQPSPHASYGTAVILRSITVPPGML